MPKYACTNCREKFSVTNKEDMLIHRAMELFCSPDCLLDLVETRGYQPSFETVPRPGFMTRPVNGTRSLYEAAVLIFMEKRNITVLYEPFAIRLQQGDRYVPDLFLPEFNVIIEIKGRWAPKGKQKVTRIKQVLGEKRFYLMPDYLCRILMR